jgi:hypothetical protein
MAKLPSGRTKIPHLCVLPGQQEGLLSAMPGKKSPRLSHAKAQV